MAAKFTLLISSATLLAREGYDAHIFIDDFIYKRSKAEFEEANIRVHPVKMGGIHPRPLRGVCIKRGRLYKTWTFVANKAAQLHDKKPQLQDKKRSGQDSALLDVGSVLYPAMSSALLDVGSVILSIYSASHRASPCDSINKTIKKYTPVLSAHSRVL